MKISAKLPWLCWGAGLLCLGAWPAYAQDLKPRTAATAPANTNMPPANPAPRFAPPPPNSLPLGSTNPAQPVKITALDGKTYTGVTVQRVDPDGLTIGFTSAGGGTSVAKIKFKNLPEELQRQYKYDPDKAAAFEAKQAQGMAAWRVQHQKADEAAKRAAIQRTQQDALEQQQAELEQPQKDGQPEMTEAQKQEAQKQIEATWAGMTSAVNAGRITN